MAVTQSASNAAPKGKVQFWITMWAEISNVKATITASATAAKDNTAFAGQPAFTACPSMQSQGCVIRVPETQREPTTPQVEAQLTLPSSAPAGDKVTVTFTCTATGATSAQKFSGNRSVYVTVAKPSSSASSSSSRTSHPSSGTSSTGSSRPTGTHSGSAGTHPSSSPSGNTSSSTGGSTYSLNGANSLGTQLPIGPLPTVQGLVTSVSPPGNAENLFPKISPSSVPNPAPGTPSAAARGREIVPVGDPSPIPPLGSAEFGAQVLGLVLLALGTVIAVTRLSLRRARTGGKSTSGR